ncbi:hypothetical protein HN911_13410 [Candidatus Bathyarchaeota archaeon]|jgi:hypothetical protein|nr:hypothetical protein [Candidatus Bathyarchaeota archaeon]
MASRSDSIKALEEEIVKLAKIEIEMRIQYHNVTQSLNSKKVELNYLKSLERKANGIG